jgi:hypothetical protein
MKGFIALFKYKRLQLFCVGRVRWAVCAGVVFSYFVSLYQFLLGFP